MFCRLSTFTFSTNTFAFIPLIDEMPKLYYEESTTSWLQKVENYILVSFYRIRGDDQWRHRSLQKSLMLLNKATLLPVKYETHLWRWTLRTIQWCHFANNYMINAGTLMYSSKRLHCCVFAQSTKKSTNRCLLSGFSAIGGELKAANNSPGNARHSCCVIYDCSRVSTQKTMASTAWQALDHTQDVSRASFAACNNESAKQARDPNTRLITNGEIFTNRT